jgi:hypothetical protein
VEYTELLLAGFGYNPRNDEERILLIDGVPQAAVVMVDLQARGEATVYLQNLYALRRGGGRRAMELIAPRASDLGITIIISPDPELPAKSAGRKMTEEELREWYRGFGFEDIDRSREMIRLPR